MKTPHIAILGTGANGASVGADLIDAGHRVTFVEQWPAHVEAMRADGLRVITEGGEQRVQPHVIHLCEVAELKEPFDIVLMLMKAYDARWAAQLIEPFLAPDGLLAPVQNGMTTRTVADVVGTHRTVSTVIECSATMFTPGLVHRHTGTRSSWFATGVLPDGPTGRDEEVATLLRHSGTVERFDDIESAKWMKLVSNATLLVTSAILNLPMADALEVPGYRELMIAAGNEALHVGLALGHSPLPIFGLTQGQIRDTDQLVEVMTDQLFAGFVRPGATTTVLQDWQRGRLSEANNLNGHVSEEGARVGVQTPVNTRIISIARRIEATSEQPGLHLLNELLGR